MSDEELASKISGEVPWWAKAPVWLAAGIVGVPSFIALAGGYFIAHNISSEYKQLEVYNLSEIHLLSAQVKDQQHNWQAVENYMEEDLKAQYVTCVNAAKNSADRSRCLTPDVRASRLGIRREEEKVDPSLPQGGMGGLTQTPTPVPDP